MAKNNGLRHSMSFITLFIVGYVYDSDDSTTNTMSSQMKMQCFQAQKNDARNRIRNNAAKCVPVRFHSNNPLQCGPIFLLWLSVESQQV